MAAFAAGEPVASGTVGLTFGEKNTVLCGEIISGTVYTYDIGGTDAFNMSFTYDAAAFTDLEIQANEGVTVLASEKNDNQVDVVLMADPDKADYSRLLTVAATAGTKEAAGSIAITICILLCMESNVYADQSDGNQGTGNETETMECSLSDPMISTEDGKTTYTTTLSYSI